MSLDDDLPMLLHALQRRRGSYGVAEDDDGGLQESILGGRSGVGECEFVGPVEEADVEGERLVEVAEGGERLDGGVVPAGSESQTAAWGVSHSQPCA